jgi:hypothetical protein
MGSNTESARNLTSMLSRAQAQNFKLTLYFETDTVAQHGDIKAQLRDAIAAYTSHPAYLRWNGKPVLFFWRPEALGNPAAWQAARREIDPNNTLLWSADTTNAAYLDAFDTIHLFSGGKWQGNTDVAAVDRQWRATTDKYNRDHGTQRLWVAGVIPGWDESRVQPPRANAKIFPRQSGALYEASWRAAIASNPEWVTITSWNEWYEGTQLEPSTTYGNQYLDLTRKWTEQYKGPQPVEASRTFPETGKIVQGKFLDYWTGHGALSQQGFPIGDQITEASLTD